MTPPKQAASLTSRGSSSFKQDPQTRRGWKGLATARTIFGHRVIDEAGKTLLCTTRYESPSPAPLFNEALRPSWPPAFSESCAFPLAAGLDST
jgi:hypothetical protein